MAQPENTASYEPGPARSHGEPGTFNPSPSPKVGIADFAAYGEVPLYVESVDAGNLKEMIADIGRRVGLSAGLENSPRWYAVYLNPDTHEIAIVAAV